MAREFRCRYRIDLIVMEEIWSGFIVNRSPGHRLHRGDAVDGNEYLGRAIPIRLRLRERAVVDDRALRAVRSHATHWVQVDCARSRAWRVSARRRSRAPHRCPHRTAARIEQLILAARAEYGWGAKKLLGVLAGRHRDLAWPARSTANDILEVLNPQIRN